VGICRHVSLLQMPGFGLLADTPGFSQPALGRLSLAELPSCFPEIRALLKAPAQESESVHKYESTEGVEAQRAHGCAFTNCTHRSEPDCVVRGEWERYHHYLDLYDEVETRETKERWQKQRSAVRNEDDHVRYKAGDRGEKRVEAKLVTKRHRHVNRRQVNQRIQDLLTEDEDEDDEEDFDTLK